MSEFVRVPTRLVRGQRWANFNFLANKHRLCAEKYNTIAENVSHVGGHRVRLYELKGNVHWMVPDTVIDITDVAPAEAPRRQGRRS
jgi:hypothetical protein